VFFTDIGLLFIFCNVLNLSGFISFNFKKMNKGKNNFLWFKYKVRFLKSPSESLMEFYMPYSVSLTYNAINSLNFVDMLKRIKFRIPFWKSIKGIMKKTFLASFNLLGVIDIYVIFWALLLKYQLLILSFNTNYKKAHHYTIPRRKNIKNDVCFPDLCIHILLSTFWLHVFILALVRVIFYDNCDSVS
jgi:hypothetical protein